MSRKIEIDDYKEWKENPITQRLFQFLEEEALVRKQYIADGSCRKESIFETGEAYMKQITAAEIYTLVANIEYDDLFSEENAEDESNPSGSSGVDKA